MVEYLSQEFGELLLSYINDLKKSFFHIPKSILKVNIMMLIFLQAARQQPNNLHRWQCAAFTERLGNIVSIAFVLEINSFLKVVYFTIC